MENIQGSEWAVFMVMLVHLILCPFTKVEESFNTQAVHDLLFQKHNIAQFPGVVPRTFSGPVVLSGTIFPVFTILQLFEAQKMWVLFAARFCLGLFVVGSFLSFCRAVQTRFGRETADYLRLITASQFHFLFYSSRPLPNVFALFLVFRNVLDNRMNAATKLATISVFVYRFELVLLFGPLFLILFLTREASPLKCVRVGLVSALGALAVTIPLDSLFWQKWLWPEGQVILFNVVQNQSHNYGTMPFFWYFYSVLPRALLGSLLLTPLGLMLDRRLWKWVVVAVSFVGLYSFLPHKELRFIIYVFPLFNLAAANFCARMYLSRQKSVIRRLLAFGISLHLLANALASLVFIYASARNYPGGDAMAHLQHIQRFHKNDPKSIHVDEFCAENGISQFLHLYDAWHYDKTEGLDLDSLRHFDYILLGSQNEDVVQIFNTNYSTTHKELFTVDAFYKYTFVKSKQFPYYWPRLKFKNKVMALKKL